MNRFARAPSITAPDWVERHRSDADQYQAMGIAGIFEPQDAVELIDGEIVRRSPVGGPHITVVILNSHRPAPRLSC